MTVFCDSDSDSDAGSIQTIVAMMRARYEESGWVLSPGCPR